MAHQRTLIRQAVVALLAGANTAAAGRVKDTRTAPIQPSDCPMISVYTTDEEVDSASKSTAPRELTRDVTVQIAAWVLDTQNVPVALALDNIASQIEAAMDGNRYITVARAITAVDPATDKLTIVGHGLTTATAPAFVVSTGGVVPGGSAVGHPYNVIVVDADHIQIALSNADARSGTAVDLTSAGTGTLQLLVANASESILESTSIDPQAGENATSPVVGQIILTYSVTYRTDALSAAAFPADDFLTADAKYPLVGGVADTHVDEDTFSVRSP